MGEARLLDDLPRARLRSSTHLFRSLVIVMQGVQHTTVMLSCLQRSVSDGVLARSVVDVARCRLTLPSGSRVRRLRARAHRAQLPNLHVLQVQLCCGTPRLSKPISRTTCSLA